MQIIYVHSSRSGRMSELTGEDIRIMSEMTAKEVAEALERRRIKAMERMAKSNFKLFMVAILKDLSPYIVLVLVIVLFIMLVRGTFGKTIRRVDKKRAQAFSKAKSRWKRFIAWIKAKLAPIRKFVTPGYKMRLFFQMIMPFGSENKGIPRQRIQSGRCDNMRWIQLNANDAPQLDLDGEKGYCFSAIRPENIEWSIEPSKIPDFFDLPQNVQKGLQSRMKIVIPFDQESSIKNGNTFFIPRCDKAYYKDLKTPDGQRVPAPLLDELGTSCRLKSYPFTKGAYSPPEKMTKNEFIDKMKW